MSEYEPRIDGEDVKYGPRRHGCGKGSQETDVIECTHLRSSRSVCAECASEVEWEMEACREHALSVYGDMRDMYRNALRG